MAVTQPLEEPLASLARRRLGGTGVTGVARLSAGASQEIWRFDIVGAHGEPKPAVLRRAPEGGRLSDQAVGLAIEAALIGAAANQGVPVPPVLHVLEPDDGVGAGFVMSFVEGETLGGRVARSEALRAVRPRLARQCGEILARIHRIDPGAFPSLRRLDPADQIAAAREAHRASGWPRPVFELAFRWLEANCPPPPTRPRVVHGDFRNGNLMVGPDGVRAVLDWEIAFVGDPMADLGWICAAPWRFGVIDRPVGGFGEREDLWAGYEAESGEPVDRAHAFWWEVFGSIRWGVMCGGMAEAFRTVDSSVERAVIARRASENEIDLLRLLAA